MTQVFRADGQVVPVTVLKAGPCIVVQRKTPTSDGYDAVQLGLMEYIKKTSISKPAAGHLKKSGAEGVKFKREFRLEAGTNGDLKTGDKVTTSGGLRGTIVALKDDSVHLRVPPDNLRLEVTRSSVVSVGGEEATK